VWKAESACIWSIKLGCREITRGWKLWCTGEVGREDLGNQSVRSHECLTKEPGVAYKP
jgi:hypothetical protein